MSAAIQTILDDYRNEVLPHYGVSCGYDADFEADVIERMQAFAERFPDDCCARTRLEGHFTGSTLLVNESFDALVLTHHKKLGKWLQLGGHADGSFRLAEVALREAQEESGMDNLSLWSPVRPGRRIVPIDLDIHDIPARKTEPAHLHLDVRYVVIAHESELVVSDESHDLAWVSFDEARKLCPEESMLRMLKKGEALAELYHGIPLTMPLSDLVSKKTSAKSEVEES